MVVACLHIRLDRRHRRLNVIERSGHAHGNETDNAGAAAIGQEPLEPLRFRRRASENEMVDWMFIDVVRERRGEFGEVPLRGGHLTAIDVRAG